MLPLYTQNYSNPQPGPPLTSINKVPLRIAAVNQDLVDFAGRQRKRKKRYEKIIR